MKAMPVELLIKNAGSSIVKAPHWEEKTASLLYVDVWSKEVHQYSSITRADAKVNIGHNAGFIIPRYNNGYIIGCGDNISYLDWKTKDITTLTKLDGGPKSYYGDAQCDPSGRIWTGNVSIKKSIITFERDIITRKHLSNIGPSGLAWTHNTLTMFCSDGAAKKIYAFDSDINSGSVSNKRIVFDYEQLSEGNVQPGGICIDQKETLWVACAGNGQVHQMDPLSGKIIQVIGIPTKWPTSCCFGGTNYDELYVTTSAIKLTREEDMNNLAGSIFRVTELGIKGMPCPVFRG